MGLRHPKHCEVPADLQDGTDSHDRLVPPEPGFHRGPESDQRGSDQGSERTHHRWSVGLLVTPLK